MVTNLKRIVVIVGHYGSGKTNLAVNLALDIKKKTKDVVLVDLDIVNPYFRSADFQTLMEKHGIEMITPTYAKSNLDIPALTGQLDAAICTQKHLIIDVGGDDAGAAALGRYSHEIEEAGGCDLLYVVNGYRYLTRTSKEAAEILQEIQKISRLKVTGVVNNSNLADITTADDVVSTHQFALQTAQEYQVPLLFTSVKEDLAKQVKALMPGQKVYPVKIFVKKPWEE
ncbi:nucleotide-binding protein [Youxingia wuxianensis]|uniref:CobQ/CobB/MinD/ParA nucleotide binding domain-containing protein n=1 Tax=Youxingia wuxianensis TaxID=2763678 RepID=A0A926EQA1_9FIRM|nr:cobalamin biosynthesis protein CobQ [Youxingia wuxianensis]MBC8584394.1 hypothetical protein [Youxingia wuxianensis]